MGIDHVKKYICFEHLTSDTWSIFITKSRTSFETKIDEMPTSLFFSTNSRIRRKVIFDERVFDENSGTDWFVCLSDSVIIR